MVTVSSYCSDRVYIAVTPSTVSFGVTIGTMCETVSSSTGTLYERVNDMYYIVRIDYAEDIGSLIIDFGGKGEKVEVLKSDALVIITLLDGKLADIQILLDDKEVIRRLKEILRLDSDR